MLYLENFLRLFKMTPIRGSILVLSATVCFLLASQKEKWEIKVQGLLLNSKQSSFFYALLPAERPIGSIRRKMVQLPGVEAVELLDQKQMASRLKKVVLSWQVSVPRSFLNQKYVGLKISFLPKISERSQELIREYLKRLVGKNNVTMTSIRHSGDGKEKLQIKQQYLSYFRQAFPFLISLPWLFAIFLVFPAWKKELYFLSKFQRRNHVELKTVFCGLLILALFLTALGRLFLTGELTLFLIPICLILFSSLFFLKRNKWPGI